MAAITLFKLTTPILLTMALSAQAGPLAPRSQYIGNCKEIVGPKPMFGNNYVTSYLTADKQSKHWQNNDGFMADWDYNAGTVLLTYGTSPTGKGVMGITWVPDQEDGAEIWLQYQLSQGQSCTAQVGKIPGNADQTVNIVDTVQY